MEVSTLDQLRCLSVADAEAAEAGEPSEAAFHDPPVPAEAGAVVLSALAPMTDLVAAGRLT